MKVKVILIGYLSTTGLPNGFKGGSVNLPDGSTVFELLNAIDLDPLVQFIIVRDQKILDLDGLLTDNDTLQFIPPFGGG